MKTNKNMTAVEWIEVELKNWLEDAVCLPNYIFEEAKQMEKEQIINAFGEKRQFIGFGDNDTFGITEKTGEEYYNKTYGK